LPLAQHQMTATDPAAVLPTRVRVPMVEYLNNEPVTRRLGLC
jgi:hypothetical protein